MKTPMRAYAKALLESAEGMTKAETKTLVERWLAELSSKRLLGHINEAISELEKIDNEIEKVVTAEITSAHKLTKTIMDEATKIVRQRTGGKEVSWQENIDERILGGAILKYGDTILDLSLKNTINSLAEEIKK